MRRLPSLVDESALWLGFGASVVYCAATLVVVSGSPVSTYFYSVGIAFVAFLAGIVLLSVAGSLGKLLLSFGSTAAAALSALFVFAWIIAVASGSLSD